MFPIQEIKPWHQSSNWKKFKLERFSQHNKFLCLKPVCSEDHKLICLGCTSCRMILFSVASFLGKNSSFNIETAYCMLLAFGYHNTYLEARFYVVLFHFDCFFFLTLTRYKVSFYNTQILPFSIQGTEKICDPYR